MIDRPCSWVGVHEKGNEMRILYVSSNIKQILDYEPSEMIGKPTLSFIASDLVPAYAGDFGERTLENVSVGYTRVKHRDGTSLAIRIISFACSDIQFNVGSFDPNGSFELLLETARVQRFQYMAKDNGRSETLARIPAGTGRQCKIEFATNSMSLIVNADACDLHGLEFLLLVVTADIAKAGEFLQQVASKPDVTFVVLNMRCNPLGPDTEQNETVPVEIMGIGSECGGILLCQPANWPRTQRGAVHIINGNENDSANYLSLEELISSDIDTSDYGDAWRASQITKATNLVP
ncbi:hypothetical protein DL89DRAFT_265336 [Linderina pennispora]|uniref:PAS domain-containing protein n=1 Tax=Linderina pennispora TaxID=61395 RepID=A0A1Y1WI84_9FUNG|nr:uncharacterized protein DL89DRAFT_265336 [Linderina pennispora]ORX73213.1 hypothetical protein DL89DRAFT_265336 [Linderina pennispora]